MSYSIVIPFFNEELCAGEVLAEVIATNPDAEIIAVDDGSADGTWKVIESYMPRVIGLKATVNRGQSAAMYAGMRHATRDAVGLMDGDGQNDPAEFPRLYAELQGSGKAFVCGYRQKRRDVASRRVASRLANAIRRAFLNDGVRDTGCSLKMMRKECVDHLVPFNGMHRYIPALLLRAGYDFSEIPVNHRTRAAGESKYTNWDRALRGVYDLIGVSWLLRRKVRFDVTKGASPQDPASHAVLD